jgi:malate dehydrogenase (oxaloacetate-decarboxylating)
MVADGLAAEEATRRIWGLERRGLLTDEAGGFQHDFQQRYSRPVAEVAGWPTGAGGGVPLAEVVARVRPTILIGTSTQGGAFTEPIVREMAADAERPIILPLSNPTSKAEADPDDLVRWTDGRALIATGSPFPPVEHGGVTHHIAQANNALVFPGLGIGVTVARAARVTPRMLTAAADAVARVSDARPPGAPLLPALGDIRSLSAAVAAAVAIAAASEGLAGRRVDEPVRQVHEAMWRPDYPTIEYKPA